MATEATIYSVSGDDIHGFYFGGPCHVTWQALPDLYYKVKLSLSNWSQTSSAIHTSEEKSNTYNTTISMEALRQITDTTSAIVTVELYTYSDEACTKLVNNRKVNNVLQIPKETIVVHLRDTDALPRMIEINVLRENRNTVLQSWGASAPAVAGFSMIWISMKGAGAYGSKIASFSISGDVSAYIPQSMVYPSEGTAFHTSSVIKTPGTKRVRITCTDTRGRSSEFNTSLDENQQPVSYKEGSVEFLAYTPPNITKLEATRNSSNKIEVSATWSFANISGNNTSSGTIYYKQSTATDWTKYNATISNGGSIVLSDLSTLDNVSYNIRLEVTDRTGNLSRKDTFVSTSAVILDFKAGGYGFGVGKVCEQDGMEVSMETTFYGPVNIGSRQQRLEDYIHSVVHELSVKDIVDIVYPVGSIYITTVFPENSTPAAIFGGSWVQIKDRFILAAGDDYPGMSVGGEASHTLSLREMPMHRHYGSPRASYDIDHNPGTHPPASQITDQSWYKTNLFSNYTGGVEGGVPGSCAAHNNLPPYMALFVWHRIA